MMIFFWCLDLFIVYMFVDELFMAVDAVCLMMFDEFCCLMMCCHDSLFVLLYDLMCVVMCFDECLLFILL